MESKVYRKGISVLIILVMIATAFALPTLSKEDVYAAAKYKITFKANKGKFAKGAKRTKKVVRGKKLGKLPKVTRPGYVFMGFYTKKSGGKKFTKSTRIKKSRTLYVHWAKKIKANSKYTKIVSQQCPTVSALEAEVGSLELVDSYVVGDNTFKRFVYKAANGMYYSMDKYDAYEGYWIRINAKVKDIYGITKGYNYKTFGKKVGINPMYYLDEISKNDSFDYIKSGINYNIKLNGLTVKPTSNISMSFYPARS